MFTVKFYNENQRFEYSVKDIEYGKASAFARNVINGENNIWFAKIVDQFDGVITNEIQAVAK